ncbi:hypothetical protein [Cupriavidus basilensis]|uniref:hypothetical protein n=1 Tax=Cupriavidus basilensis TaxID=68895 RepID=UPI0039F6E680
MTESTAELKARIARLAAALRMAAIRSAHNTKMLNEAAANLYARTGEVYSNGAFVIPA